MNQGFINIDLEEILNGGEFYEQHLSEGRAMCKLANLESLQMDMFDKVIVSRFDNGITFLEFLSNKYAPSKKMMEFMSYCTSKWGVDKNGRGEPCEADIELLRNGKFGRIWPNVKICQAELLGNTYKSIAIRIIIDNQDMSNFAKNLAKGFVRSAVNQVGRDGGRVISNRIYNGRNYVPVAGVEPNTTNEHTALGTPDEFVGSLNESEPIRQNNAGSQMPNAVSTTTNLKAGKLAILVLVSFFVPILGGLGSIIYGIVEYFNKSDKLVWYETEPQYITDRRYKTGYRYARDIKVKHSATVAASAEQIKIHQRNGIAAMCIGVAGIIIDIVFNLIK